MFGGLDLAAKEINITGLCIIHESIELYTVYDDDIIIKLLSDQKVTAIDAPLTEKKVAFRDAERKLMKDYGPIMPINMIGMRKLSQRGLEIKNELSGEVIETFSRGVEKSLEIDIDGLDIYFENQHEYDAYLCALAAKNYYEGNYRVYGKEEVIIIPRSAEK
ncbi:MAG: hypothetical protein ACOCZJ_02500 [Thermoplasmatota archaeon]